MSNGLILLSLLYAVLAFLTLALVIRTHLPSRWKSLLVIAFTGLAILSHLGWKELAGWPAKTPLPEHFLYHAATIREPNPGKNDPGVLQIWATELRADGPAPEPRAYELPYVAEDHKQIQEARERIRQGLPQVGRLARGNNGNGQIATGKQNAAGGPSFVLANLPEPALPEK